MFFCCCYDLCHGNPEPQDSPAEFPGESIALLHEALSKGMRPMPRNAGDPQGVVTTIKKGAKPRGHDWVAIFVARMQTTWFGARAAGCLRHALLLGLSPSHSVPQVCDPGCVVWWMCHYTCPRIIKVDDFVGSALVQSQSYG